MIYAASFFEENFSWTVPKDSFETFLLIQYFISHTVLIRHRREANLSIYPVPRISLTTERYLRQDLQKKTRENKKK